MRVMLHILPFARVPVLALIGAITDRPVAIDRKLEIRPMITLTATVDHRYIDGSQGANLAKNPRGI